MREIWIMSNRQPWVEALARGLIRTKTRSYAVWLPPIGAIVFLHASKALWQEWKGLEWAKNMDVPNLPRGGIYAVATVEKICDSHDMPERDWPYFYYYDSFYEEEECCAGDRAIVFRNVKRIPFIPCRGVQSPSRKLPPELEEEIKKFPEWIRKP